jgi:hypothetical protein
MKLWIDADAAPRDVKEIVFRAAKRLEIEAILVANQRLYVPPGNAFVTAMRVEGGPDVADLQPRLRRDRDAPRFPGLISISIPWTASKSTSGSPSEPARMRERGRS